MILYTHLFWFSVLATLLIIRILLSLYTVINMLSIQVNFSLFSSFMKDFVFSVYFDSFSCLFLVTVLIISRIIMVYSYYYINPYSKPQHFLWLTVLFVLSILFLISTRDLFFVILGWDGLGLVSFLLIVYFQNQSSIYSGLFTVLINRLGDAFFLLTISLFFLCVPTSFMFTSSLADLWVILLLLLTFITKSAIYPFSSWLPLAMAAPTPISALVHSSTLVTAGLFLLIRFSYLINSRHLIMSLIIILGLFTSFYSGLNSISETDFKKLIALSTLSHLGFILTALGSGLVQLAFFHLLAHALFKSLLFMCIGDIIIALQHSQDARYLSSGMSLTPLSTTVINVSLLNLLGIPSLSGYFSKDLILENFNFSFRSSILEGILYFNLLFTYYYRLKLFFYSFKRRLLSPFQQFHSPFTLHSILLLILGLNSIIAGKILLSSIFSFTFFPAIRIVIKLLPFFLLRIVLTYLVLFLKPFMFRGVFLTFYSSSILFLTQFITFCSYSSYYFSSTLNKSLEQGSMFSMIGSYTKELSLKISISVIKISILNPILTVLLFIPLVSLILIY